MSFQGRLVVGSSTLTHLQRSDSELKQCRARDMHLPLTCAFGVRFVRHTEFGSRSFGCRYLVGLDRTGWTGHAIAAPDRPPETIAAATARHSGLLCEPGPSTLHSGS